MVLVEWEHDRRALILPIVLLPPPTAANPTFLIRTVGLLDTGATASGIRGDIAAELSLRPKGQRRVDTANGMIIAAEYLVRVGFICGNLSDPDFVPDQHLPYVLEKPILGFELQAGFNYPVLIGMDVIGQSDLHLKRDGRARMEFA